jgi:hypothetical protein
VLDRDDVFPSIGQGATTPFCDDEDHVVSAAVTAPTPATTDYVLDRDDVFPSIGQGATTPFCDDEDHVVSAETHYNDIRAVFTMFQNCKRNCEEIDKISLQDDFNDFYLMEH